MRSKIWSMCTRKDVEIEDLIQRGRGQRGGVGVGLEQRSQRPLLVPGAQGVSLHDGVGVLAAQAGLDQPQEHAAREHEAVRRLEVPQHPLGVHLEPLDQPAGAVEHVVEGDRRVGQDDPLGRRVRDVALVPEGDVLEADERVRRAARARGRRCARTRSGCACAASPRSPSGRAANGSTASRTSVRWRWRISSANRSSEAPSAGDRAQQRGVPVAGDDLRRDRLAVEAERREGRAPRRGGRRWRRRRRRPTACRRGRRRAPRSSRARPRRSSHQPAEQLEPERRRLGVHAVGAADRRRVPVLLAPGRGARRRRASMPSSRIRPASRELQRQRRVDDVGRREAVVEPARRARPPARRRTR